MSKRVIKVQFLKENTQIGTNSIPESVIEPTRRNYAGAKVNMTYAMGEGLTIHFEGTPYTQFVPNHNIASLLLEEVSDDQSSKPRG